MPVRVAATTVTTLSEADITIIVDRVMKNLQQPVASGTPVCPASSEGERGHSCSIATVCVGGGGGGRGL